MVRINFLLKCILAVLLIGCFDTQEMLEPKDFLQAPRIIDSSRAFGLIRTESVIVPAKANIYLADSSSDTVLVNPADGNQDTVPENSPIKVLDGYLEGGETLDIFATGTARNRSIRSTPFGPNGLKDNQGNITRIQCGPLFGIREVIGPMGALVGMFDNQHQPFIIGQRQQIQAPRGAHFLYLAVLDFPGSSSDNEGEYSVTIDLIRR